MNNIINALSVDVEDYYHVSAFSKVIKKHEWGNYESRVYENTMELLDLFDDAKVKSTFFVLGMVAEKHPFHTEFSTTGFFTTEFLTSSFFTSCHKASKASTVISLSCNFLPFATFSNALNRLSNFKFALRTHCSASSPA